MAFIKERGFIYVISLLLLEITLAVHPIIFAFIIKNMVNAAIDGRTELLKQGVVLAVILLVIRCIINPIFSYICSKTVRISIKELKEDMFKKVESLPMEYFDDNHSGDVISTVTNDIRVVEDALWNQMCFVVGTFLIGLLSAISMFKLDWRLALALMLLGVITTRVSLLFSKPIRKYSDTIQANLSTLTQYSKDILSGIYVIKIFQIGDKLLNNFDKASNEYTRNSLHRVKKSAQLGSYNYFISTFIMFAIFFVGAIFSSEGYVDFGTITALLSLQGGVTFAFLGLGSFISQLQASFSGAERMYRIFNLKSEKQPEVTKEAESLTLHNSGVISFSDVTFGYSEKDEVLKNLNLVIEKGQRITLTGLSGEGKSTLLKLLLGFYYPQKGCISINGKAMNSYSLEEVRNLIAYIPQEPYIFDGTIEENIRLGRLDATREEIIHAADLANAHSFIVEMQDNYNTKVGEKGSLLSGGQRQRIVIARAFLKDAPILIMDEATSALDSESELKIQASLDKLVEGRTVLSISHRLSMVDEEDLVCMIKNGSIIEKGKHSDLLSLRGEYFDLYKRTQNLNIV